MPDPPRSALTPALLAACALASISMLTYCGGLAGRPISFFLLPTTLFPLLAAVIFSFWAIAEITYGMFRRALPPKLIPTLLILLLAWPAYIMLPVMGSP